METNHTHFAPRGAVVAWLLVFRLTTQLLPAVFPGAGLRTKFRSVARRPRSTINLKFNRSLASGAADRVAMEPQPLGLQQGGEGLFRLAHRAPRRRGQAGQLEFMAALLLELIECPLDGGRPGWIAAEVAHLLPAAAPEAELVVRPPPAPLGGHEALSRKRCQIGRTQPKVGKARCTAGDTCGNTIAWSLDSRHRCISRKNLFRLSATLMSR